jgi:peptidase M48-like protein/CAAX prenyl protease-like protein
VVGPILIALGAAEAGARLLAPRAKPFDPVPVELGSYFSDREIERGRAFARPQMALGLARSAIEAGALSVMARRQPRAIQRISGPALGGAAAGAGLSLALTLPAFPVSVLARRRAIEVGLVTQSWRGWGADMIKSAGLQGAFTAAAGAAVTSLTRRYPRSWWAPAAAGSVLFGTVLAAVAPVVLDPIFNRFTPLPAGGTREDVLTLARAAGVKVGEVYSVDASRRTTAANAYVTGIGPTKRVVLFDTLLDRYSRDEVRVVVAHELAHVRGRDVPRSVLFAALVAPASALAVQRLSWRLSAHRGSPAALPDSFALKLTGAPDAFVSFERTIALQNVADLDPPRWVTSLLSTHPSTAERIGIALGYANQAGR